LSSPELEKSRFNTQDNPEMTKKLEQLKPVIERLYVKEGKPLNEVRDLIKAKFGLEVW
jgi:hypothetical protein